MREPMNQERKFQWMTTAPIPGLVSRLAVPTIISMLITSLYNMADTYFVGSLGTSAQGAVGVVFSLMAIIQAIGFTFGNGAGNYVSRLLGQKQIEHAEKVASIGFYASLFVGVLFTVLGLVFLEPLIRCLGATDTIRPYAKDYAQFILLGAAPMISSLVLNNLLRFSGSATYAMAGIASGAVINIALDPLFIFYFDMGISGAAIATIISQFISFTILLVNSFRNGNIPVRWKQFSFDQEILRTILRGGLPSLYRQGLASVASILLNWAAKPYGDAAIAAMTIVSRFSLFSGSAIIGFGQGLQPVCGFNFGAKLYSRVREAFWFCIKVSTIALLIIAFTGILLAPQVVLMFQKNDPQVIKLGVTALRCQLSALPTLGMTVMNMMMFQTVGETKRATVMAMARQGLFFIPCVLIFPIFLDFTGVMIAQPISDLCASLLAIPLCRSFMKKLRVLESQQPASAPSAT